MILHQPIITDFFLFSGFNAVLLNLLEMSLSFSEIFLVILNDSMDGFPSRKFDAAIWAKLNGVISVLGEDTTCHVRQVILS